MKPEYFAILMVAAFWGGYPLLTRATGVTGPIVSLVMAAGSLAVIAVATFWQGVEVRPTMSELVKLAVAGAMMGVGLLAFNCAANSRAMDASVSIPIMDTSMLLTTTIGAIWFFAEPITGRKVLGLALLLAGIFVLKPE